MDLPVPDIGDGRRESADVCHVSSRAPRAGEGCPAARGRCPTPHMVKHVVIATFRAKFLPSAPHLLLTPRGEGGCCSPNVSIKVVPGRAESGRGRNPDPRRDQRRGGGSPGGEPPPE